MDWETMTEVGESFFPPIGIYWQGEFVILAYQDEFYVCETVPNFALMKKYLYGVHTGLWFFSVFLY
jgi:hypothetical protein